MKNNLHKWNYDTRKYDEYTPNPDWDIVLMTFNMDLPINCASCGKDMTYGQGYTSQEIHTEIGLGYPVCEECYALESQRRSRYGR